jgi:hypothetical protein
MPGFLLTLYADERTLTFYEKTTTPGINNRL